MLDEDPTVIIFDLLRNNWDSSNTILDSTPKFQTGWYDHGSSDPQVSITNTQESVSGGGMTGHSGGTGAGGVSQIRRGYALVNCWAGTYEDMQGAGANGSDVSPKEASYDMAKEVHRIAQENASGTTDDSGNKQLHSLGATNSHRIVEDDRDAAVFRQEVRVQYTYSETTN